MKRWHRTLLALGLAAFPTLATSQDRDPFEKLDPTVRMQLEVLLDSARTSGLPTQPLESKALEGISKRVDGRRILNIVRVVFKSLREARLALGPKASADELSAAAAAFRVGITPAELARLSLSRHGKPVTVPLVVLTDLVTRGVPRDTASTTIFQLWQRGAAEDDFLGLWRGVERDIVSGTDPGVALLNRAREVPFREPVAPPARPEPPENHNL